MVLLPADHPRVDLSGPHPFRPKGGAVSIVSPPQRTNGAGHGPTADPVRDEYVHAQRLGRLAGIWFLVTFITSIPALLLYDPLLNDADYILGSGAVARIQIGALLEIGLVISGIATAIVFWPVLRRQSEVLSLSYVASRITESALIATGIVSVLAVLTLREDLAPTAVGLDTTGQALVAVHDATFLLGPAFCAGFGNGLLLGWMLYRSGLVPPRWALVGVIGGPIAFLGAVLVLFDAFDNTSTAKFLLTVPEIVWELFVGIYLTFHGYRGGPLRRLLGQDTDAALHETPRPAVAAR